MRWEEKSAENCVLTLDESNLPVTASKPSGKPYSAGSSYDLNVESNWKLTG